MNLRLIIGPKYWKRLAVENPQKWFEQSKKIIFDTIRKTRGEAAAHRASVRWLVWLCSKKWIQHRLWLPEINYLRHFAVNWGISDNIAIDNFVHRSLTGQLWRNWHFHTLMKGSAELRENLVTVEGWENFVESLEYEKGLLLLTCHGQFTRIFMPWLKQKGYEGVVLGQPPAQLAAQGLIEEKAQRFELARQTFIAKKTLMSGGIVYNLPDSIFNLSNSLEVPFFNRRIKLAVGFAEIALQSDCRILMMSVHFDLDGQLILKFNPSFAVPDLPTREERRQNLVERYAEFLVNEWSQFPWNVPWYGFKYYFDLPQL